MRPDARFILWAALFWLLVMLAVLPLREVVVWMGWLPAIP
jgi:hypothetical protein